MQPIGRMTLNRCPANFFAEVEQVAFHIGHLVRGIEVTDDPLMHARLFSYLDTQLTRLGGPNFAQIPINRPHAPVNDNFRDGFHQQAVHHGQHAVPARTRSAAAARSSPARRTAATSTCPDRSRDAKVRERGPDDEYAQATLFWNSMTEIEQDHIVDAYTFELGKVDVPAVVERMVTRLSLVDDELRPACVRRSRPARADASGPRDRHGRRLGRRRRRASSAVPDATGGLDVLAGAVDDHRERLPGRRPGRADPRQRRLRPRRHPRRCRRRSSPPARCRTWSPPTRARSAGRTPQATSSPSTGRSTPPAPAECDAIVVADGAGLADDPGRDHVGAERLPALQADRRLGRRRGAAAERRHRRDDPASSSTKANQGVHQGDRRRPRRAPPLGSRGDPPDPTPHARGELTCRTESTSSSPTTNACDDLFAQFDGDRRRLVHRADRSTALEAHDHAEHGALYPLAGHLLGDESMIERFAAAHSCRQEADRPDHLAGRPAARRRVPRAANSSCSRTSTTRRARCSPQLTAARHGAAARGPGRAHPPDRAARRLSSARATARRCRSAVHGRSCDRTS